MSGAYYNEHDPYAAQWLRNLIAAGHIAPGDVDERSIEDVAADDLAGYTQCHFFAGIGVWSHALRRSGWDDDRPVWTGSCPCQPFSAAGKGEGTADERHLWPAWFHLIEQCRPPVVFGEQVEAAIKHGWLDLVQADLEGVGYAFAAAGIPAAGVGAPHIRQRLWFVADSVSAGWSERRSVAGSGSTPRCSELGELADDESQRRGEARRTGTGPAQRASDGGAARGLDDDARLEGLGRGHQAESGRDDALRPVAEAGESGGVADATHGAGHGSESRAVIGLDAQGAGTLQAEHGTGPVNGHWRDADWLFCRDGKWRPVESGTFPLVDGTSFNLGSGGALEGKSRVGMLRAAGNAIVAPLAAEFIRSFMECVP